MSMIDAIAAVWSQHDRTFMFRHACHHASCGTCAVRLDGYEKLPCIVPVKDALAGREELGVEPLRNFPLVGDLVVDVTVFFQKQAIANIAITRSAEPTLGGQPYQRAETFNGEGTLVERPYYRFDDCIECGICLSACPTMSATETFVGPAGLAALHRAVQETCDGQHRSWLLALADGEQAVWRCHSAFECTEACPQNADPAAAIMALRGKLIANKFSKPIGGGGWTAQLSGRAGLPAPSGDHAI
jgi:succinate dehydrogenase / fumarate reductase iron-sulfur subunit